MIKNIAALMSALVLTSVVAHAEVKPIYSEVSFEDASNQCSQIGTPVGLTMETSTAQAPQFYVVICSRPDGNGGTVYIPAWSASSFDNANQRCESKSATTGLAAGEPAGQPLFINASKNDIYLITCELN